MLVAEKDAASSASCIEPSNPIVESESAVEDDDWVIVKKRKITILIPPTPPADSQTECPEMNCIPTKSKRTATKRRHKHLKGELKDPAVAPSTDGTKTDGLSLKAQESDQSHTASVRDRTQVDGSYDFIAKPTSQHVHGDGNAVVGSSETCGGLRKPPFGAVRVVNRQLRALNLERKLQGFGGLRSWLLSQGLGIFVRIFEKEKLGKYQLANLTTGNLKDMGADAVGPRRKLIHAIDRLCQPYYLESLQSDA